MGINLSSARKINEELNNNSIYEPVQTELPKDIEELAYETAFGVSNSQFNTRDYSDAARGLIDETYNTIKNGGHSNLDKIVLNTHNIAASTSQIVGNSFHAASKICKDNAKKTDLFPYLSATYNVWSQLFENMGFFYKEWRSPIKILDEPTKEGEICNSTVSPYKVQLNLDDRMVLKHYTFNKNVKNPDIAVVLGNPFAGHADIIDYRSENHSLVQTFLKNYEGHIFGISSPGAKPKHRNYSYEDEVLNFNKMNGWVSNFLGQKKIDSMNMCSRGKTAFCAASLEPELYRFLGAAGSPLDMEKGNAEIVKIAKSLPQAFFDNLGSFHNGVVPGYYILAGFLGMQPNLLMGGFDIQLGKNIISENLEKVEDRHELLSWYFTTIGLPQKQYSDEIRLFKHDSMVKGDVQIDGKNVDFKNLNNIPHILMGGKKDNITPEESCVGVKETSKPKESYIFLPKVGHIGLYVSKDTNKNEWPEICSILNNA